MGMDNVTSVYFKFLVLNGDWLNSTVFQHQMLTYTGQEDIHELYVCC